MAFKLGDNDIEPMHEMNLIPLIDIMLVLMVVLLVTAAVLNPTVPLQLPSTSAQVDDAPPDFIQISIDKNAGIFWNEEPISMSELEARMIDAAVSTPVGDTPPTVRLRADKEGKYGTVAQVLSVINTAGLTNVAFVSK